MTNRIYRCFACLNPDSGRFGRDFAVEIPDGVPVVDLPHETDPGPVVKCPECGTSNLEDGAVVAPVEVIHYEPPKSDALRSLRGCGTIACNPEVKTSGKGSDDRLRYTGETRVVNCPACKATDVYKRITTTGTIHPGYDVPVAADKKGGVTVPEVHTKPIEDVAG